MKIENKKSQDLIHSLHATKHNPTTSATSNFTSNPTSKYNPSSMGAYSTMKGGYMPSPLTSNIGKSTYTPSTQFKPSGFTKTYDTLNSRDIPQPSNTLQRDTLSRDTYPLTQTTQAKDSFNQ